jgi:hypothetical protein
MNNAQLLKPYENHNCLFAFRVHILVKTPGVETELFVQTYKNYGLAASNRLRMPEFLMPPEKMR